jgi:hypothetical protein
MVRMHAIAGLGVVINESPEIDIRVCAPTDEVQGSWASNRNCL